MKQNIVFFNNGEIKLKTDIEYISKHKIKLKGVPVNLSGFKLFLDNGEVYGVYEKHTTLYQKISDDEYILSDDNSIWEEPVLPEPQIPTIDDLKKSKKQEISSECEQTIYNGVDIDLNSGKEHFSLTIQDQLNLMNKKSELNTQETKFKYHADGKPFTYFSKEEMEKIINVTDNFIENQRIYCNNLYRYIEDLQSKEEVQRVKYGIELPEKYKSVSYSI